MYAIQADTYDTHYLQPLASSLGVHGELDVPAAGKIKPEGRFSLDSRLQVACGHSDAINLPWFDGNEK